jgi:hypothetical protein
MDAQPNGEELKANFRQSRLYNIMVNYQALLGNFEERIRANSINPEFD